MHRSSAAQEQAVKKIVACILCAAASVAFLAWWLASDDESRPLVCEQISPGVKHARECSPAQMRRVRDAHLWVVDNFPATLSRTAIAGVASFIEDSGRRTRTDFYKRMRLHDVDGGCEAMLSHVTRRGEVDPDRVKRRKQEREMCLSKE